MMNVNVLFLCGVFDKEAAQEVVNQAVGPVEYSAIVFQEKMISGFKKTGVDLQILSAPFIGAYPKRSKTVYFKGFEKDNSEYQYVSFNNIWGYRNFSRAHALKKKIKDFADDKTDGRKLIVVYSAHEPFLEAAIYAKKLNPQIKICYVVPDLPQYMNLDANRSFIYDFFKKIDILRMNRYIKYVDSFVLLTEHMKEIINVGNRPSMIVEGIVDGIDEISETSVDKCGNEKYLVYTGKMNEKFGVKDLVNAFRNMRNNDYRLVLCGSGDCDSYIEEAACSDKRIMYLGQVTPEKAREWQEKADVLVNPRSNNEEYTKYSFPSKNIEYLLTGNPVVAYKLDGMGEEYINFIYIIDESKSRAGIISAIEMALNESEESKINRYNKFINYVSQRLDSEKIARGIINDSSYFY